MAKRLIVSVLMSATLLGCEQSPAGDVIAVVNGDEITLAEFNAAMAQAPAGIDPKLARNAVLDRLVSERLLVQAAKSDGLDKSQDYIVKLHSAENLILSSMFVKATADKIDRSHIDNIDQFIATNPSRFADRVVLLVDQIKVPQRAVDNAWIKDTRSLDDIGRVLSARNVAFERGRATVDSLNLGADDYRKIAAVPDGSSFAVVQDGVLVLTTTIAKQPSPLAGEPARRLAARLLRQKAQREGLENRIKLLRSSAKVEYQRGFAAPSAPATSAPST